MGQNPSEFRQEVQESPNILGGLSYFNLNWYKSKICQTKIKIDSKRSITCVSDLLNPLGLMESREKDN